MIDIIIPLYNSKTIWFTLASIAYQDDTDVTVTIVDDCSSSEYDYSKMLDFFKKYLKIQYIRLEKNSGPGVARQKGIEATQAPYIMFIDSDDSLGGLDVISKIKKYIIIEDKDFIIGRFVEETFNKQFYFRDNDQTWLHGKIYRRKFLERNHIHFNDTYKNEDNFFNQLLLLHAPRVGKIQDTLYVYRNNMDSLTRSNNYAYNYEGTIYYAYNISEAMREALEDGCDPRLVSVLGVRCLIPIYYYYIEYYQKKDVSKLIKYGSRIYHMIDYQLVDEGIIRDSFCAYIQHILNTHYEFLLSGVSFEDFKKMLGDYHD